jgi:hypothetical protein
MPMPKNNCHRCSERYSGCHSTCESYLIYASECERIRRNRNIDQIHEGYIKQQSNKACRIHFGKASY